MASLDDIWDEPAEPSSSHAKSPSQAIHGDTRGFSPAPAKRPSTSRPLFLDSDSDREADATSKSRYASKSTSNKPDIDAFFADLDDDPESAFQDLAPSLDVAALKRQADAKHALTPHQILPSSSPPRDLEEDEGGKKGRAGDKKGKDEPIKKKKKRPTLNEARLLGPDGFPALVKQAKEFKPKGKGHELQDLNRLMNVYQFWAHKMYPNTHFIDTVQRVEKICHSKRMNVALSVWRDEAKGLINGLEIPGPDDPLDSDDSDADAAKNARLSRAATREPQDVPIATEDERSSPARHGASLPPSSPSSGASSLGALDDDFDIDAMIREDEDRRAAAAAPRPAPQATYGAPRGGTTSAGDDEDAAMWDAVMDDFPDEPYVPPERQPQPAAPNQAAHSGGGAEEDMDEDMWDMVREMEAESAPPQAGSSAGGKATAAALPSGPSDGGESGGQSAEQAPTSEASTLVGVDPTRPATNDEGWDEMYA
ncbi:replication fork protection component Swi3-domain-containing protein [Trametes polyzona]|nr:replication fork protection component Swi3-domain-containing protein [Trametes polyzona]